MRDEIDNRGWNARPAVDPSDEPGRMPAEAPVERPTEVVFPRSGGTGVTGTGEQTWLRSEQLPGLPLYTFDGVELGTIEAAEPGYFSVPTDVDDLGPTLYVPITAVSSVSRERCVLNLPLFELRTMAWNVRPDESAEPVQEAEAARAVEADSRRVPWADATSPPVDETSAPPPVRQRRVGE